MPEARFHPKALAEANRSAHDYDDRRAGLGADFFDELDSAVEALPKDPLRPPADSEGIRSWRMIRFPFRVYYAVDPDRVRILTVAHLRRRLGYWRARADD